MKTEFSVIEEVYYREDYNQPPLTLGFLLKKMTDNHAQRCAIWHRDDVIWVHPLRKEICLKTGASREFRIIDYLDSYLERKPYPIIIEYYIPKKIA